MGILIAWDCGKCCEPSISEAAAIYWKAEDKKAGRIHPKTEGIVTGEWNAFTEISSAIPVCDNKPSST